MATVRVEWAKPPGPAPDPRTRERQEAAVKKELEQAVADAALAAKVKEAVEAAGERSRAQKAAELDELLLEHRAKQDPNYVPVPVEFVMWPDGIARPYRRASPGDIEADLIYARLKAGLPADPAPRMTPTQRAEARFNAEQNRG